MAAIDRIRKALEDERPAWADDLGDRKIVLDVDQAEALCDLADAARNYFAIEPGPERERAGERARDALARLDGEDSTP